MLDFENLVDIGLDQMIGCLEAACQRLQCLFSRSWGRRERDGLAECQRGLANLLCQHTRHLQAAHEPIRHLTANLIDFARAQVESELIRIAPLHEGRAGNHDLARPVDGPGA